MSSGLAKTSNNLDRGKCRQAGWKVFAHPSDDCLQCNAPQGPLSYLTLWPAGTPRPLASILNSFDGTVVSNAAIALASFDGTISVFVTNTAHVILDINGYFQ